MSLSGDVPKAAKKEYVRVQRTRAERRANRLAGIAERRRQAKEWAEQRARRPA